MLHPSPVHHSSPHHQLFTPVSPCSSSHSPTASDDLPPAPGSYESAEESGCEGHEPLEEEVDYANRYYRYRISHDQLSISPPTPPITRQRSHTYCGQEFPRLPFLSADISERCHSNDALWMRANGRRSSVHFTNSVDLYETRSSISSSTSTSRRKSLSRCVQEEETDMTGCTGLRRALSSLSLRLLQGEKERPVQRILRPPRRRQTMRGLSGLPIESVNQWNSAATISG